MSQTKEFYKTTSLVASWFGLKPRLKLKFTVNSDGIIYNSRFGNLGLISYPQIESIYVVEDKNGFKLIGISIADNHRAVFKSKLSQWGAAMSREVGRLYQSDLVIFPNEIDDDIEFLYKSLILAMPE